MNHVYLSSGREDGGNKLAEIVPRRNGGPSINNKNINRITA
jgi:hypothetical protein